MSHILLAISNACLTGAVQPRATFDVLRERTQHLLSRLLRPRLSSLRVSQRWLDEHEAGAVRQPQDW